MSLEDFQYGRVLGKGVFGSVLIVKRKEDNEIYAMKRVKIGGLTKKELENSFNEVRLLASLNHKNVIGYREAFYDQQSKTLNIVMEYADDGDLSTKIKQAIKRQIYFDEQTIWSTLIQIFEGLKYLHKSDIIHRDLKSANIFLTKKGGVKIGDLNVSKIIGKSMAITQTGTPYYASPEIWNDHPYDYKCDIWSAGCIIYEMASLKMPFRGTSMQMLYNNVMKGNIDPIPSRYSAELMEIIKIILTKNPHKRPSAEELLKNKIIVQKMEKFGVEQNLWNCGDEKAMLIRTIKIPRNLNQMNQINGQLPRKNYKKERYQNQLEMLENDEYETAKNSFYHPNDNKKNNNKKKNSNNINTINKIYYDPVKKAPLIEKKNNLNNGQNMTEIESNNNYVNNKYNCNYNYNLNNKCIIRSKSNMNNNMNKNNSKKISMNSKNTNELIYQIHYKNEKEILKKITNYINNKKEEILSPQQIMTKNRKYRIKNSNTESLRISTSNVFTTEGEKTSNKVPTTINEPIKLINNPSINSSINNVYCNKEEKNRYIPISSINNGNSFINSIFESQINKLLNKKINVQNSISSIQQQSRQRQNKYITNPSCDNILKNKKIRTLETQKKRIANNNKNDIKNSVQLNYNNNMNKKSGNREIVRNRSCKGAIYKNPLLNEEILVEDKLLKKKKKFKNNQVRRNISTDFLNKKNSLNNCNESNYRKNNNSHILSNERNSLKENLSNNTRFRRIRRQLEDILPPFEFEKIFRNRLLSANNDNTRKKNNVNVKININNNYNYINNVNMDNNNNNNNFVTENRYQHLPNNISSENNNYDYYYNNKKSVRPKSTSSIINNDKYINNNMYRPPPMQRYSNVYSKDNKNNLTEINDNFNSKKNNNNIITTNNNNSSKKYKEFYNFYYHKFLNEKMKNSNNSQKIINFNRLIEKRRNNININNNNNNEGRKVIYEKINVVQNQGEERKYIKGPSIVRCIGEGNFNNQCHKAIIKYQNILKYHNDYSIQNLINKDFRNDKTGPRIILPKKMMMEK